MDANRVHTSIVIELGNQEDAEYQKAYQFEFGDLDIPRDYVIDQIFCGENITVYAVFEISEDGRKLEKHLEESNFDVHGDYRIYREKVSRKLLSDENFCKFIPEVPSKENIKLPLTESRGMLYRFPAGESPGEEVKAIDPKVLLVPEKISLGTNTSLAKFTPLFFDKEVQETNEIRATMVEPENETGRKSEGTKAQTKERNKNAILREIKKLQKKITSLIKTIESSDFDLDAEDLDFSGADSMNCEKAPKSLEAGVVQKERKKNKKYDEIPIFSTLNYPTNPKKVLPKQKRARPAKGQERRETALTRSVSLLSVGSSTSQIVNVRKKSLARVRKGSSDCSINWRSLENWRGAGASKSEMVNQVIVVEPKYNVIKSAKKSLSLELREDKLDVICLKKFKNFPCKLEGNLKAKVNNRVIPKREPSFRDSLPLVKCEMGDEALKKSKTDLLSLVQVCDKQNALSFEKINLTPNKNLNEEEGDAKLVYRKHNLVSPRCTRNTAELEVHFRSATNNTGSDALPKTEKALHTTKLKLKPIENNVDPLLKICSDSEKPTTPNKNYRRTSTAPEGKKEVMPIKKPNKKTPRDKPEKNDPKDVPPLETIRPKSVTGGRKSSARGHPEPKTQTDKPVKSDINHSQKTAHVAKHCSEEKAGNKIDRLPRPISQKREISEAPNDTGETKEKESKTLKRNSLTVNCSHKKSVTVLTTEKAETVNPVENEQQKPSIMKAGQTSEDPPSVAVELLSERSQPEDIVLSELSKKKFKPKENSKICIVEPAVGENNNTQVMKGEDSDEFKIPVVKSLWALTKIILFEDGTQKLEILEASLNPPEWV